MPYDPNFPPANAELTSPAFREQFQGLAALIAAVPADAEGHTWRQLASALDAARRVVARDGRVWVGTSNGAALIAGERVQALVNRRRAANQSCGRHRCVRRGEPRLPLAARHESRSRSRLCIHG